MSSLTDKHATMAANCHSLIPKETWNFQNFLPKESEQGTTAVFSVIQENCTVTYVKQGTDRHTQERRRV